MERLLETLVLQVKGCIGLHDLWVESELEELLEHGWVKLGLELLDNTPALIAYILIVFDQGL